MDANKPVHNLENDLNEVVIETHSKAQLVETQCSCNECDTIRCFTQKKHTPEDPETFSTCSAYLHNMCFRNECEYLKNINVCKLQHKSSATRRISDCIYMNKKTKDVAVSTHSINDFENKIAAEYNSKGATYEYEYKNLKPGITQLTAQRIKIPNKNFKPSLSSHQFDSSRVQLPRKSNVICDIFQELQKVYEACSCKVCECLAVKTSPGNNYCNCEPCACKECTSAKYCTKSVNMVKSNKKLCVGNQPSNCIKYLKTCRCKPCECVTCESLHSADIHVNTLRAYEVHQRRSCQCSPCDCVKCQLNRFYFVSNLVRNTKKNKCLCKDVIDKCCTNSGTVNYNPDRTHNPTRKGAGGNTRDYDIPRATITQKANSQPRKLNPNDTLAMFSVISNSGFNKKTCYCDDCKSIDCKHNKNTLTTKNVQYTPETSQYQQSDIGFCCNYTPCELNICARNKHGQNINTCYQFNCKDNGNFINCSDISNLSTNIERKNSVHLQENENYKKGICKTFCDTGFTTNKNSTTCFESKRFGYDQIMKTSFNQNKISRTSAFQENNGCFPYFKGVIINNRIRVYDTIQKAKTFSVQLSELLEKYEKAISDFQSISLKFKMSQDVNGLDNNVKISDHTDTLCNAKEKSSSNGSNDNTIINNSTDGVIKGYNLADMLEKLQSVDLHDNFGRAEHEIKKQSKVESKNNVEDNFLSDQQSKTNLLYGYQMNEYHENALVNRDFISESINCERIKLWDRVLGNNDRRVIAVLKYRDNVTETLSDNYRQYENEIGICSDNTCVSRPQNNMKSIHFIDSAGYDNSRTTASNTTNADKHVRKGMESTDLNIIDSKSNSEHLVKDDLKITIEGKILTENVKENKVSVSTEVNEIGSAEYKMMDGNGAMAWSLFKKNFVYPEVNERRKKGYRLPALEKEIKEAVQSMSLEINNIVPNHSVFSTHQTEALNITKYEINKTCTSTQTCHIKTKKVDKEIGTCDSTKVVKICDSLKVTSMRVRRISDHTVLVKWNIPRTIINVRGYELQVDGQPIQQMFSPSRRMAVVTCLSRGDKTIFTIRTIVSEAMESCQNPATSIVFHPRAR